jgi:hypothetical protein
VRRLLNRILRYGFGLELVNHCNLRYAQDGLYSYHDPRFLRQRNFNSAFENATRLSGTSPNIHWRLHVLLWAFSVASKSRGVFIELGVDRGFMSGGVLGYDKSLLKGKELILVDTFEGIPLEQVLPQEAKIGRIEYTKTNHSADFDSVRNAFKDYSNVKVVKGRVPDILPKLGVSGVAFAHLDLNSAVAEEAAFRWLWPLIPAGGVVMLDDYCYRGFQPQGDMYDRLALEMGFRILSLPTGQGLIIKPSFGIDDKVTCQACGEECQSA